MAVLDLLRLTKSIAVNGDLQEDRIVLYVVPSFDLFVFGEFCSSKACVFLQFRSAKERFIFWTRIRLDAEFDVFSLGVVVILIQ